MGVRAPSGAAVPPTSGGEISVRVVYLGMPSSFTGTKQETVALASPAHLSDLENALSELHPGLKGMFPSMLILIDGASGTGNPALEDKSEVDILAASAGG